MSDPLFVQPDGLRSYSQIHDEVVAGLSHLMGTAAPEVAGVQTSHGAIASAVSTALSTVLGSRQATMQTTATSGSTISELLKKAAQMYEQGDQRARPRCEPQPRHWKALTLPADRARREARERLAALPQAHRLQVPAAAT
jgi:hypothetical protein